MPGTSRTSGIPRPRPARPRSRRRNRVRREQGRAEPDGRHRSPAVTASSTVRQSPAGEPAGANGRDSGSASGSTPISACRSAPARPANRDRHDRAVDAGTCQRPPSRPASHGRAVARPAAAAAAASTSTVMTIAAPYRRRDHKSAGSSTCVRTLQAAFPGTTAKGTGRAAAITDMATVASSSNPRTPNPPNHIKTTRSTALLHHPVDILNGG